MSVFNPPPLWKKTGSAVETIGGEDINIDGTLEIEQDAGAVTLIDMDVSGLPVAGTEESYTFKLDGEDFLTIYGEADGSGNLQNASLKTFKKITAKKDSLGTTSESMLEFINSTPAVDGTQQVSPALLFEGQGYATTPAESQKIQMRQVLIPSQGTTNPSAFFYLQGQVNESGSWYNLIQIGTSGQFRSVGHLYAGASGDSNLYVRYIRPATAGLSLEMQGSVADGATAIANKFGNLNALTMSGGLIAGFYSDSMSTLKASIDNLGIITINGIINNGILIGKQGTDIASANDATLTKTGNYFDVTGTTQINTLSVPSGITAGTEITLQFDDSVTIKQATAGAGAQFQLAGSVDFSATAGDILKLVYDGTKWRETGRVVM